MKIAVLSHSFLTPPHIEHLKHLGDVVEYESTNNEKDAVERLEGVEVAIADCWDVPLKKGLFDSVSTLKFVSLNSTGFNQVDLQAAKERGVKVANVPGFSTDGVAELAIGLMFAVCRHIPIGNKIMHEKPFQIDPANRVQDIYLGNNLRGKTLGVIGLGQIGSRVAELGQGLGMTVVGYNRTPKEISGVQQMSLETLLKSSDVISLNLAFVEDLKELIGEKEISLMKPTAVVINTARGELVNETALAQALREKHITGYGADVLADWSSGNPLLSLENVVLTPHSGFFTEESLQNMADVIVANVEAYSQGNPINVVNP